MCARIHLDTGTFQLCTPESDGYRRIQRIRAIPKYDSTSSISTASSSVVVLANMSESTVHNMREPGSRFVLKFANGKEYVAQASVLQRFRNPSQLPDRAARDFMFEIARVGLGCSLTSSDNPPVDFIINSSSRSLTLLRVVECLHEWAYGAEFDFHTGASRCVVTRSAKHGNTECHLALPSLTQLRETNKLLINMHSAIAVAQAVRPARSTMPGTSQWRDTRVNAREILCGAAAKKYRSTSLPSSRRPRQP